MRWKTFVFNKKKRRYFQFALGIGVITAVLVSGFLMTAKKELSPITHGDPNQPKIAFACNIFWGEEFLPGMLRVFDENDIKITFFIGGSWAKKNPDLVKLIAEHGHEIGNHTYSHPHPNNLTKEQNQDQILRTEALIKEITGITTRLYAPPYGEYNAKVLEAAHEIGYTTIMWSIDTIDWQRPSVATLKKRVLSKLHNGAIVLMHPTEPTLKALPSLIAEIREKGYTITTVSDIIN